jgi:transposase-like protein
VRKESIRKKIDEAKEKLDKALRSESVSKETVLAFESLIIVIDIMVAVFLEKKTRKNSSNSGLPPSRNNGSNGNRNKDGSERDKKGSQLKNTRKTKSSETLTPSDCDGCGHDLSSVDVKNSESRKKIDIIYEITEHTITSETKQCPSCGQLNKPNFPKGMEGKIQYGIGIKASIIDFLTVQMISLERTQEHFKGLVGRFISQAVMLKYIAQFSESLKSWEAKQVAKLLESKIIHVDETSLRVETKNFWIHSYSAGDVTLKFVHRKRGCEAIEDIGIIPKYGGTIIHDSWASYLSYEHVDHGLCGSHLLRELKFIEDSTGDKWAIKMKKLLQKAAETVGDRHQKRVLTKFEFKSLQSRYRNILTRAKKELPAFSESTGKRGRPKQTDAQNLWKRLCDYEESVLLFAKMKEVDFTNNRAERDLRVCKLKQKVAGCFRTPTYAEHFCRISSYIKSMRYRGYSSLEAIMLAFQGEVNE